MTTSETEYDAAYEQWLTTHLDDSVRYFRDWREARGELGRLLQHGPIHAADTTCSACGQSLPCQFQRLSWAFDTEMEVQRMQIRSEVADELGALSERLRDPNADIEHECERD